MSLGRLGNFKSAESEESYSGVDSQELEKPRRICPACRTLDPPTEPAYGCPECGMRATISELDGEVPELCPWCGDGKLKLVTEVACGECGQGEVQEREVYPCLYCGEIRISQYERHSCPRRPSKLPASKRNNEWTLGAWGKVAYLRLKCRAGEERVRVNGRCAPAGAGSSRTTTPGTGMPSGAAFSAPTAGAETPGG